MVGVRPSESRQVGTKSIKSNSAAPRFRSEGAFSGEFVHDLEFQSMLFLHHRSSSRGDASSFCGSDLVAILPLPHPPPMGLASVGNYDVKNMPLTA